MYRARRVDRNHSEIKGTAHDLGASILDLYSVGEGCPDLLLGIQGYNYLVEVKDGSKPPSQRKLTQAQQYFKSTWKGQYQIIKDIDEMIRFITEIRSFHESRKYPVT